MKRIVSILMALCMLVSLCAVPACADEAVAMSQMQTKNVITITVDGNYVDCAKYGQMPVIVEGRTLVPLRSVFEALGATVEWNNDTRSVTSVKGEVTISLAVDSKDMNVNGAVKTLDVPAQIMNERTMVPVRAVAEAFGCKVEWNNDTRTVVITTATESPNSNIPVIDVNDADGSAPTEVVKAAYDAMMALDFEKAASFYKNPETMIEGFGGAANVTEMVGMVAGDEELTAEQIVLVEKFTKDILNLMTYKITGMSVIEDMAEVYVTVSMPDFENMNIEEYLTEEAMTLLMLELIEELGYSADELENLTADEEAVLTNVLIAGVFEYIVTVFELEAETVGYIVEEDVEVLTKVDGKWLIGQ